MATSERVTIDLSAYYQPVHCPTCNGVSRWVDVPGKQAIECHHCDHLGHPCETLVSYEYAARLLERKRAPTPPPARGEVLEERLRQIAENPMRAEPTWGEAQLLALTVHALRTRLTATEARLAEAEKRADAAVAIAREAEKKLDRFGAGEVDGLLPPNPRMSARIIRDQLAKIGTNDVATEAMAIAKQALSLADWFYEFHDRSDITGELSAKVREQEALAARLAQIGGKDA